MKKMTLSINLFGERIDLPIVIRSEQQEEQLRRAKEVIASYENKVNAKYGSLPRSRKLSILLIYLAYDNIRLVDKVNELEEKLGSVEAFLNMMENMDDEGFEHK